MAESIPSQRWSKPQPIESNTGKKIVKTPLAFFIYKRPEYTGRVWEEIRKAKPPVLLIVADGPRDESDCIKCDATRAIVARVDWPCDVRRNYSPVNMGCRDRMASGLNWVFKEVEEAVILEDDCLPNASFFLFCDDLLARYRDDDRVMHIAGSNFLQGRYQSQCSYYYSKYSNVWGWATWRRAWRHYDVNIASWPGVHAEGLLRAVCPVAGEQARWSRLFDRQHRGATNTWDYAWQYTCWVQHGVCVVPCVNLVSNIGLGADSTHQQDDQWYMNLSTESLGKIDHPAIMMINSAADNWAYNGIYKPKRWERIRLTILNPWAYGAVIRKIPIVGEWWSRWRVGLKSGS